MKQPIEIVRQFLIEFSTDHENSLIAMRKWLTRDCVWSNTGLPTVHGLEECIHLMEDWSPKLGVAFHRIDVLHIGADGDQVLTERIDNFFRADRSQIMACNLMGSFRVRGQQICSWSDYYDAQAFVKDFGFHYERQTGRMP